MIKTRPTSGVIALKPGSYFVPYRPEDPRPSQPALQPAPSPMRSPSPAKPASFIVIWASEGRAFRVTVADRRDVLATITVKHTLFKITGIPPERQMLRHGEAIILNNTNWTTFDDGSTLQLEVVEECESQQRKMPFEREELFARGSWELSHSPPRECAPISVASPRPTLRDLAQQYKMSESLMRQCNPEIAQYPFDEPLPQNSTVRVPRESLHLVTGSHSNHPVRSVTVGGQRNWRNGQEHEHSEEQHASEFWARTERERYPGPSSCNRELRHPKARECAPVATTHSRPTLRGLAQRHNISESVIRHYNPSIAHLSRDEPIPPTSNVCLPREVLEQDEQSQISDPLGDLDDIRTSLPTEKTLEQMRRRLKLFNLFDENRDGVLSLAEVQKGMRSILRFRRMKYVIKCAFNVAMKTGSGAPSGFIGKREFQFFLMYVVRYFEVRQLFDELHIAEDDEIEFEEFCDLLPKFATWGVKEENPEAVFQKVDSDGRETIFCHEYIEWVLKKIIQFESRKEDETQKDSPLEEEIQTSRNADTASHLSSEETKKKEILEKSAVRRSPKTPTQMSRTAGSSSPQRSDEPQQPPPSSSNQASPRQIVENLRFEANHSLSPAPIQPSDVSVSISFTIACVNFAMFELKSCQNPSIRKKFEHSLLSELWVAVRSFVSPAALQLRISPGAVRQMKLNAKLADPNPASSTAVDISEWDIRIDCVVQCGNNLRKDVVEALENYFVRPLPLSNSLGLLPSLQRCETSMQPQIEEFAVHDGPRTSLPRQSSLVDCEAQTASTTEAKGIASGEEMLVDPTTPSKPTAVVARLILPAFSALRFAPRSGVDTSRVAQSFLDAVIEQVFKVVELHGISREDITARLLQDAELSDVSEKFGAKEIVPLGISIVISLCDGRALSSISAVFATYLRTPGALRKCEQVYLSNFGGSPRENPLVSGELSDINGEPIAQMRSPLRVSGSASRASTADSVEGFQSPLAFQKTESLYTSLQVTIVLPTVGFCDSKSLWPLNFVDALKTDMYSAVAAFVLPDDIRIRFAPAPIENESSNALRVDISARVLARHGNVAAHCVSTHLRSEASMPRTREVMIKAFGCEKIEPRYCFVNGVRLDNVENHPRQYDPSLTSVDLAISNAKPDRDFLLAVESDIKTCLSDFDVQSAHAQAIEGKACQSNPFVYSGFLVPNACHVRVLIRAPPVQGPYIVSKLAEYFRSSCCTPSVFECSKKLVKTERCSGGSEAFLDTAQCFVNGTPIESTIRKQ